MKKLITILLVLFSTNVIAQNSYIPYNNNGKWGLSDKNGTIKIPCKYDSVNRKGYYPEDMYYVLHKKKKTGVFIDATNQLIPAIYDKINDTGKHFFIIKNKKHGILSSKNKFLVPMIYDTIGLLDSEYYFSKKGEQYFKINKESLQVTKIINHDYEDNKKPMWGSTDGITTLDKETIKSRLGDKIDVVGNKIGIDRGYHWVIVEKDGKEGLIEAGKRDYEEKETIDWILNCEYDKVIDGDNFRNIFLVKNNGYLHLINDKKEELLPLLYSDYQYFSPYNNYLVTKKNGLVGIFIINKKIDIQPKYEYIIPDKTLLLNDKLYFYVKYKGKEGYINDAEFEYFK